MESQRVFNIPPIIALLIGMMVAIHILQSLISTENQISIILYFAFIPARYSHNLAFPGGTAAQIWTYTTYAFLHADITHLIMNTVWMLAFGSALAKRMSACRFLVFFIICASAGAIAHQGTSTAELVPMIGASAAISGCMAAASRFIFVSGTTLGPWNAEAHNPPAISLKEMIKDKRIIAFLGIWFAINLIFGLGIISMTGEEGQIAWQAHIGGFLAGLLLFPWLDPIKQPIS